MSLTNLIIGAIFALVVYIILGYFVPAIIAALVALLVFLLCLRGGVSFY